MTTKFDEYIECAKSNIDSAIRNLRAATDDNTYGYKTISTSYIDEVMQVIIELMKINRKL